jgi:hypothetical protein
MNGDKLGVELMLLGDAGYKNASVGGLLIAALERLRLPGPRPPEGVLDLVWAIANSKSFQTTSRGLLTAAFERAREKDVTQGAMLISRWLQRTPLTPVQGQRMGLARRIDWEGELIPIAAELFSLARHCGVLSTFFFFIDQIEELFRPNFSELRRARLLTDLRGLVDEIDAGAPVGLLLAWTPDVEQQFQLKYDALFGRMKRRRVDLPQLPFEHALGFAKSWVEACRDEGGFDPRRQPPLDQVVQGAWARLKKNRMLFPGDVSTPRDCLTTLAEEIDHRAGL